MRLGEIAIKIGSGATPRGGEDSYLTVRSNFALVRSQNVLDRRFDKAGLAFISEQQAAALQSAKLHADDLLLNITGDGVTFSRVCAVPEDILPACVNQHVAIIRVNPALADPGWVLAYLTHSAVKVYIESFNAGASRRAITKGHIESFALPLPPLSLQRVVARILGMLDEKIDLNRRMSETVEALAQALFDAWFKARPRTYLSARDLVHDGVLEIGDGYRAKNSEFGEPGLPFIRAADLNNGFDTAGAERLRAESVAKAGSKVSRVGDVAFTSKGTIGRLAGVTERTERFVYSPQVCFWRSLDHRRLDPTLLYCWMRTNDFKGQIESVAGQTDMAPYVSLQDQRRMRIPAELSAAETIASSIPPLLSRQAQIAVESRCLGALRDMLLPKLISGELRVRDAERLLERVL